MSRRGQPAAPSSLLANLAASPFVNKRPVQRFAALAWMVGALLTGVNVALWAQYRHESTTLRDRLAETRAAIDRKSKNVVEMDEQLRGLRLGAQNAQVKFLNDRIAERTFPWSLLFERMASTLPDGVRLMSLTPVFDEREGGARREKKKDGPPPTPEDELISIGIRGAAKTDDFALRAGRRVLHVPGVCPPPAVPGERQRRRGRVHHRRRVSAALHRRRFAPASCSARSGRRRGGRGSRREREGSSRDGISRGGSSRRSRDRRGERMTMPSAWRARWWRWALPLAVVIANAVVLIVHPGRTGAGFADMEKELASESHALRALGEKEKAVEAVLDDARSSREALALLYRDRFSTQAERLTQLITEVKRLAQRAGLEPKVDLVPRRDARRVRAGADVAGVRGAGHLSAAAHVAQPARTLRPLPRPRARRSEQLERLGPGHQPRALDLLRARARGAGGARGGRRAKTPARGEGRTGGGSSRS